VHARERNKRIEVSPERTGERERILRSGLTEIGGGQTPWGGGGGGGVETMDLTAKKERGYQRAESDNPL